MTPNERTEGQYPSEQPHPPIEIGITPDDPEAAVFTRTPDGGYTIFLHGEIQLTIHPPAAHAAESPVPDAETPPNGLLPESTSSPVTDRYSGTDMPSWEKSRSAFAEELPESENRKFQLVGNPARKLRYRVTKRTNTKIADFVLASHPAEETTEYWRIRAFGKEAEKVRDQVAVGQKGVAVTVYGPKYWEGRKKTPDGTWEDTVVKGYHAGFVKVPKRYRDTAEQESL